MRPRYREDTGQWAPPQETGERSVEQGGGDAAGGRAVDGEGLVGTVVLLDGRSDSPRTGLLMATARSGQVSAIRADQSLHDPGYSVAVPSPATSMARISWQAVTPLPQ